MKKKKKKTTPGLIKKNKNKFDTTKRHFCLMLRAEKNTCLASCCNTSLQSKLPLKKISTMNSVALDGGHPILKCDWVVTVRPGRYKNKSSRGRFKPRGKLILQSFVRHTPFNCGGLAGITGNQRRYVGRVLFLDYIKSVVMG